MEDGDRPEGVAEAGSGNVFADLGLNDIDESYTRSRIGHRSYSLPKNRDLKRREAAALPVVKQPVASHLIHGHFSRFTTDELMDFLKRLDHKVTIRIGPASPESRIAKSDLTLDFRTDSRTIFWTN